MNLLETLQKQRPCILFLGQNYLSVDGEKDYFLSKIKQKTNSPNSNIDYKLLNNLNTQIFGGKEDAFRWMQRLCDNISVPEWLSSISEIPFASIYTSAIDNIGERAFEQVDWRNISRIYSISDAKAIQKEQSSLDNVNLSFSYLFGSIKGKDDVSLPPITTSELRRRTNTVAKDLMVGNDDEIKGIPTLIRKDSIGVLIVEGYSIDDWFNTEKLEELAEKLGESQIHLFSTNEELRQDEILSELHNSGKIVFYQESFAQYIKSAQEEGFTIPVIDKTVSTDSIIIGIGKELKLLKRENANFKNISKYSIVVNEELFIENQVSSNESQRYSKFKEFLAARSSYPMWSAYHQGYVFNRTFFKELIDKIENYIGKKDSLNQPIILYGQSSSGKSIGLGYIAYQFSMIKDFKVPIIFIDGKKQRLDSKAVVAINDFCKEIESSVKQKSDYTPTTLVIWDGNQLTDDEYFNLQKSLIEKGRNILVIGTMYTSTGIRKEQFDNYIEAPITLDDDENSKLIPHFGKFIDEEFIKKVIYSISGKSDLQSINFLTLLYRLLPETRDNIKKGLKKEISAQSEGVVKNFKIEKNNTETFGSIFATVFKDLYQQFDINPYLTEVIIDDEVLTVIEGIKLSVAAVKQFPTLRSIPLSIIVRIYGIENINNNLLDNLEKIDDFIRVEQDDDNESSLTIRTSEEAKIWLQDRLDSEKEFTILENIIKNINDSKKQIDFAIKLLDYMSPQKKDYKTKQFTIEQQFRIFKTLKELREKRKLKNSRLIVQESSFIREVVKNDSENRILNKNEVLDYLSQIDKIIDNQLNSESSSRDKYTYLNLLNEKIILNCYKIDNEIDIEECIKYYEDAIEATTKSRFINPSNFYPVSAMFHVTESLLKKDNLGDEIKKNVLVDILTLFNNVEFEALESFKTDFQEQFYKDKVKIAERLNNTDLYSQNLQKLNEINPSTIHYLEILKIIGWDIPYGELSQENIEKSKNAFGYLNQASVNTDIENDSRCLYLKLKFWWQWKTGHRLYANEENQVLPFDIIEWRYCLGMIDKLLAIENGNYSKSHLDYIRAVCLFHLDSYRDDSFEIFKKLESEFLFNSQFIHGRLTNRYLASQDSKPMLMTGELANTYQYSDKEGEVYIKGMRQKIKFSLFHFGKQKDFIFNKNSTLNFYIGFSFRYPFAIPANDNWKLINGEGGENE